MEASGLGNDPDVLKAFANIAKTTMADKDLAGPSSGTQMALTPEEARAEASTIMSHPAYTDKRHPEHNSMVKKVQALFNQAYTD
jgi:ABC-type branched-subunit amino acid transport system substrate-binding protein